MKIGITSHLGHFFLLDWPDNWRIPVQGELLLLKEGTFRVDAVQWEFEDDAPGVQLRVREES
jgi:hypothetical protein